MEAREASPIPGRPERGDPAVNVRRVVALAKPLYGSVRRSMMVAGVGSAVLALVILLTLRGSGVLAVGSAAFLGSFAMTLIGWAWARDPQQRAAHELLVDHDQREMHAWRTAYGARVPATARGTEEWLASEVGARATPEDRSTAHVRLGRLDAAWDELDRTLPSGPFEEFVDAVVRRQIQCYAGLPGRSIADLHAQWAALPAGPAKDWRRGCLAMLEAMLVIDADPRANLTPVLAAARAEQASILPSAGPRYFLSLLSGPVIFTTLAVLVEVLL